jgi:hypothetical protein
LAFFFSYLPVPFCLVVHDSNGKLFELREVGSTRSVETEKSPVEMQKDFAIEKQTETNSIN